MSMTVKTFTTLGGLARIAGACGLIALAAGVMPGCIIVADGTRTVVVSEPAINQSRLDQIRLGVTTKEQARAILGAPTTRVMGDDNNSQVWTYAGSRTASGRTVVFIDEDDDEIRTEQVRRGRVVVEFRDGVVTAVRKE